MIDDLAGGTDAGAGDDIEAGAKGGADKAANGKGGKAKAAAEPGLAGAAGAPKDQAEASNSWYREFANEIPDDVRPEWEKHAARYASKAEFGKSFVEMRKTYDQRVPLPSSPAEMAEFYQKHGQAFGIPKDPTEYEMDIDGVPWDDTEKSQLEEYRKVALRNGRSKTAFKEDIKFLKESRKLTDDARIAKAQKTHSKNMQVLKDDWQFDFEQNVAVYQTAVNEFAKEDKDSFLTLRLEDGTLVQNHPIIAKMFARAGRRVMEDDRDLNDFNRTARTGIQSQIDDLEVKLEEKHGAPENWPKDEHEKLRQMYGKLHGSRPKGPHQMYGRGSGF